MACTTRQVPAADTQGDPGLNDGCCDSDHQRDVADTAFQERSLMLMLSCCHVDGEVTALWFILCLCGGAVGLDTLTTRISPASRQSWQRRASREFIPFRTMGRQTSFTDFSRGVAFFVRIFQQRWINAIVLHENLVARCRNTRKSGKRH